MGKTENIGDTFNYISNDTIISGDIKANYDIVIKGVLEGGIICKKKVQVEEGACVKGDVVCLDLYLEGKIEGNVKSTRCCELRKNAIIKGMLECSSLVTDFNVVIEKGLKLKK